MKNTLSLILFCFIKLTLFSQNCGTAKDTLDINQVSAVIHDRGNWQYDYAAPTYGYEVPKGSGIPALFTSAYWIGALDTNNQVHLAANYYSSGCDYFPGPMNATNPSLFDKVWNVKRYKIEEFKYEWGLGNVQNATYTPDSSILTWPAIVDTSYAPFVDINGNGIYDPLVGGDYPKVLGDQCLYWIINDNGTHVTTSGTPLGIEVHTSAYSFTCPQLPDSDQVLNYTTLYHCEVINRSASPYHKAYWGLFQHANLGNWQDDNIGCYPKGNYGYSYNNDSIDDTGGFGGYGSNPPVVSTIMLNGPLADNNDSIDNDNDSIIDEPGEKNLMSGFIRWFNGGGPSNNPSGPSHYYNYLKSIWGDNTLMTQGGSGYNFSIGTPTRFIFPDFPYDTSGWSEYNVYSGSADERYLMSSGPFTFLPKSKAEFDFAIVWTRDTTMPWLSKAIFDKNYADNMKIKQWFLQDSFPSCLQLNLGINESQISDRFAVFPNPFSRQTTLQTDKPFKNASLTVYNSVGQTVKHIDNLAGQTITFHRDNLPSGLYFVRLTQDGNTISADKFVIVDE